MNELVKILNAEIKAEVQRTVEEFLKSVEMFSGLPSVSTTSEMAKVFRVSDDVIRRTAEEGMPHVHAGRELRFVKALIAEWTTSGKKYFCEICEEKSGKPQPPAALALVPAEQVHQFSISHNVTPLNGRTKSKLADFASAK